MRIELVEYDPQWPAMFEDHAARIRAALGDRAVLIEHAGSTSIPGLAAKPRIDVILAVPDSTDEAAYVPALESAGYNFVLREPDWFEHRLMRGTQPDSNIHIFSTGSPEIDKMLLFRDWLRSNKQDRSLYERTKREFAQREWEKVQDYADAKTEVVEAIVSRARAASRGEAAGSR
jgi:GrpB-like predicted nucleotidyltransferase (UPF0157 family)